MEYHPHAIRLCALIFITFNAILHLVEAQDQKGIYIHILLLFLIHFRRNQNMFLLSVSIHFVRMCH